MGSYVRSILVLDASGAQFQVHEFLVRERVFNFIRKHRRFRLDTGEPAEEVDPHTFRLTSTGETLVRASS